MTNLCQLSELGLSCMGCCGNNIAPKQKVARDLDANRKTYHAATNKKRWGDRLSAFVASSGICYNLIREGDEIFCPLHPMRNEGKDIRDRNCDKSFICKTFFQFQLWEDSKKKQFIAFIKEKNLDWYDYSIGMDSGKLLEEFTKNPKG